MLPISVTVRDTGSGIDTNSVEFVINTFDVSWFVSASMFGDSSVFRYTPMLPYSTTNNVFFSVSDMVGNVATDAFTFYFTLPDTGDTTPADSEFVISGFVFPAGGGLDFAGFKVLILELGIFDTTNMAGQFSLPPVPGDTYTIGVSKPGYIPVDTVINLVSDTLLVFTVSSSGGMGITISGSVILEGETNHAGSVVRAVSLGPDSGSAVTNASGFYTISLSTPGIYYMTATHTGFETDSALVVAFWDTTINFNLRRVGIAETHTDENPVGFQTRFMDNNKLVFRCEDMQSFELYDFMGRMVVSENTGGSSDFIIDLTDRRIVSGTYFVRIKNANGSMFSGKIIIVR